MDIMGNSIRLIQSIKKKIVLSSVVEYFSRLGFSSKGEGKGYLKKGKLNTMRMLE